MDKEETMMKKSLCLKSTALAIAAAFSFSAAAQEKQIDLKLSSWVPLQHPLNPSIQAWADDVKKEAKGTIASTLYT